MPDFTITLRGRYETADRGTAVTGPDPLTTFGKALAVTDHPAPEPVLTWRDNDDPLDHLAAVDLDFHDHTSPDPYRTHRLTRLSALIQPRPAFSWHTHGGGLRLIYAATDVFTAA